MTKQIKYAVLVDGKALKEFDGNKYTTERSEAEKVYAQQQMLGNFYGNLLELVVTVRGITTVLKSEKLHDITYLSESEEVSSYNCSKKEDDIVDQIISLHEAGLSSSEIASITGKTPRVIQYNIKKLKDQNRITSHGKGRVYSDVSRKRKAVTIQLYEDNYDYLMDCYRNVSNIINDLVDADKAGNAEVEQDG